MISPLPSMFAGRVSSETTCSWSSWSSAASSIVTIRSVSGMKLGEHVEERRLADAGAARDQDVQLPADAALRATRRSSGESVPRSTRSLAVSASAENLRMVRHRPLERERRDDHVHARTVGQAGVDHRRGFVDAAADGRDDPLDHAHQMTVVGKARVGLVQHAGALDEHLIVAVHHHLGDRVVAEELIDRPVAEHLVDHVLDDPLTLFRGEPLVAAIELDFDDRLHATPELVRRRAEGLKLRPDLRDTHVVERCAQLGEAVDRAIARADARLQGGRLLEAVRAVDPLLQ